ncbi:MAG: hypothetical protein GXO48_07065 [Chlorobi bacterium]|nr:hypothetical protein [Chlorobiota bacterium]
MLYKGTGLITGLRKSKCFKVMAWVMVGAFCVPVYNAFGLTEGPSTPEYSGFDAVKPGEHVDPFTGDFSYSIPLASIDGQIPLTLTYSAEAVSYEGEASWVGLGWNLNTGSIQRAVNGVPDDAKGEEILQKFNMKPEREITIKGKVKPESFGIDASSLLGKLLKSGFKFTYNNYTGIKWGMHIPIIKGLKIAPTSNFGLYINEIGLGAQQGKGPQFYMQVMGYHAKYINEKEMYRRYSSSLTLSVTPGQYSATVGFNVENHLTQKIKKISAHVNNMTNGMIAGIKFIPLTFGTGQTYPLYSSEAFKSTLFSATVWLGTELFGIEPGAYVGFDYRVSKVSRKERRVRQYGYLYLHDGYKDKRAKLDYLREKEGDYVEGQPITSPSYLLPDFFIVGAPGLSFSFVPQRNHWGYIASPYEKKVDLAESDKQSLKQVVKNILKGLDALTLGLELGGGNAIKLGVNIDVSLSDYEYGKWDAMAKRLPAFRNNDIFFKVIGQINELSETAISATNIHKKGNGVGYRNPVKLKVNKILNRVKPSGPYPPQFGLYSNVYKQPYNITYYTVGEAKKLWGTVYHPVAKPHHIGRFEIVSNGGMRHVFGKTLYNLKSVAVSFRCEHDDYNKGVPFIVAYKPQDASFKNKRGEDHYYSRNENHPYAYAFLLTEIYSSDYVDRTGNGPSDDDLGWWAEFNYTEPFEYKWRAPFGQLKAYYAPGKLISKKDGTGTYQYGIKQVSYLHSIESPFTYVEFHTSPRLDALGVKDEHGRINIDATLYKLDSISVYLKDANGDKRLEKQIKFQFDYSLAQGTPNSRAPKKGRLTLRKITIVNYDIYGGFISGRKSYSFDYYDGYDGKPVVKYEPGKVDRWGIYNPHIQWGFPYATQDERRRNEAVRLWKLKKVTLPTGATITVEYESDRYFWVQNKRAQRMFNIVGFGKDINSQFSNLIYDKNIMFVDAIPDTVSSPQRALSFAKKLMYESDLNGNMLYVKVPVSLRNAGPGSMNNVSEHQYDYMEAFVKYMSYEVVNKNGRYFLAIKLEPKILLMPTKVNPITWYAIQKGFVEYSKYVFASNKNLNYYLKQKKFAKFITQFLSLVGEMLSAIGGSGGMRMMMLFNGIGASVALNGSFVRLSEPSARLGGGARVSAVRYTGYKDTIQISSTMRYIYGDTPESGGVTAFEPLNGHEENPFMKPLYYSPKGNSGSIFHEIGFLPVNKFFIAQPIMIRKYPSPTVGYQHVTVINETPPGVLGTGYVEYEFHTLREAKYVTHEWFSPISKKEKTLKVKKKNPFKLMSKLLDILKVNGLISSEYLGVSQSFVVINHEMHGKIKEQRSYDAKGNLIVARKYYYKKLVDGIDVVGSDGAMSNVVSGTDVEFLVDIGHKKFKSTSARTFLNNTNFIAVLFPVSLFVVLPFSLSYQSSFSYVTTTMSITYHYTVDKIEVTYKGREGIEQALAYDLVGGKPLVSKTIAGTIKADSSWQVSFPAYWFYPELGSIEGVEGHYYVVSTDGEGKIQGLNWTNVIYQKSATILGSGSTFNFKKDVMIPPSQKPIHGAMLRDPRSKTDYWIIKDEHSGNLYLINKDGNPVANLYDTLGIIRSGKKNFTSIPSATASLIEPPFKTVNGKTYLFVDNNQRVMNASLLTFSDKWQITTNADVKCFANDKRDLDTLQFKFPFNNGWFEGRTTGPTRTLDWGNKIYVAGKVQTIYKGHHTLLGQTSISGNGGTAQIDLSGNDVNDLQILTKHVSTVGTEIVDMAKNSVQGEVFLVRAGKDIYLELDNKQYLIHPMGSNYVSGRFAMDNATNKIYLGLSRIVTQGTQPKSVFLDLFEVTNYGPVFLSSIDVTTGHDWTDMQNYNISFSELSIYNGILALGVNYTPKHSNSSLERGALIYISHLKGGNKGLTYIQDALRRDYILGDVKWDNDGRGNLWVVAYDSKNKGGTPIHLINYNFSSDSKRRFTLNLPPKAKGFKGVEGAKLFYNMGGVSLAIISDNAHPTIVITRELNSLFVKHGSYHIGGAEISLSEPHNSLVHSYPKAAFNAIASIERNGGIFATFGIYATIGRQPDGKIGHTAHWLNEWQVGASGTDLQHTLFARANLQEIKGFIRGVIDEKAFSPSCFKIKKVRLAVLRDKNNYQLHKIPLKNSITHPTIKQTNVIQTKVYSDDFFPSCGCDNSTLNVFVSHPEDCCDGTVSIKGSNSSIEEAIVWHKPGYIGALPVSNKGDTGLCPGDGYGFSLDYGNLINNSYYNMSPESKEQCEVHFKDIVLMYNSTCYAQNGGIINPYVTGARGRWMVKNTWTQRLVRAPESLTEEEKMTVHGYLKNWKSFVKLQSGKVVLDTANWTRQNTVTLVQPWGEPIEERNILGIYSSALYGYRQHLPVMIAANAKYSSILFTSFEDSTLLHKHVEYTKPFVEQLWQNNRVSEGHGGYWAVELTDSFVIGGTWYDVFCSGEQDNKKTVPYIVSPCDLTRKFQPAPGKSSYVFAWIKWPKKDAKVKVCNGQMVEVKPAENDDVILNEPSELVERRRYKSKNKNSLQSEEANKTAKLQNTLNSGAAQNINTPISITKPTLTIPHKGPGDESQQCDWVPVEAYDTPTITLVFSSVLGTFTYEPEFISASVDGWRLYRWKMNVPPNACGPYSLKWVTNKPVLMDDIRIEPEGSGARAIVYDWQRLRVVTEFGPTHFGAFYRYDERGSLTSTLIETEEGKLGTGHQRQEIKQGK